MSQARTNSLPAARTRPSICAIVTSRLALRWWKSSAIDASPVSFASSCRHSAIRVIDVRDEVLRIGAAEHHHADFVVGLGALDERDQVADQLRPEQVHGRRRDLREPDAPFLPQTQRPELRHVRSPRNALTSAATSPSSTAS
jgi:hypothetical protein